MLQSNWRLLVLTELSFSPPLSGSFPPICGSPPPFRGSSHGSLWVFILPVVGLDPLFSGFVGWVFFLTWTACRETNTVSSGFSCGLGLQISGLAFSEPDWLFSVLVQLHLSWSESKLPTKVCLFYALFITFVSVASHHYFPHESNWMPRQWELLRIKLGIIALRLFSFQKLKLARLRRNWLLNV